MWVDYGVWELYKAFGVGNDATNWSLTLTYIPFLRMIGIYTDISISDNPPVAVELTGCD